MSGATSLSANGALLIERFEGGESSDGLFHAYFDTFGRVWTIGYGETQDVHEGMTWTPAQARADLLSRFASEYAPSINDVGREFNQNQFDALGSLVWNCGPGVVSDRVHYSMARDLHDGDFNAASQDFMHYVFSNGVRLEGLVTRREAEQKLFDTRPPTPVDTDPHHYLWFDGTVRQISKSHSGSERAIVEEYDEKRVHPHEPGRADRLHTLRVDMAYLAGRLATFLDGNDANNEKYHRQWRHDGLLERSEGDKVV